MKVVLRREALARRDALSPAERSRAAEMIAARAFPLATVTGTIVSGFAPMKSEINPLPLMRKLSDAGAKLALPVVAGKGKPLTMRAWNFGEPLGSGVWGIREPKSEAAEVEPDILIVPLLAFDRSGHRIGYGAGYYDLTIAALRAKKPTKTIERYLAFDPEEHPISAQLFGADPYVMAEAAKVTPHRPRTRNLAAALGLVKPRF